MANQEETFLSLLNDDDYIERKEPSEPRYVQNCPSIPPRKMTYEDEIAFLDSVIGKEEELEKRHQREK